MALNWTEVNEWERSWWGDCRNTFHEEFKQFEYLRRVKIYPSGDYKIDVQNKSILDVGGGPVSPLLKCFNMKRGRVVDPCSYPDWVWLRYNQAGIEVDHSLAEEMDASGWDEVWLFNVLQHVLDPQAVLRNARNAGKVLRLFEWVYVDPCPGHPHVITCEMIDEVLGGKGTFEDIAEWWCPGRCYYGVYS